MMIAPPKVQSTGKSYMLSQFHQSHTLIAGEC